MSHMLLTDEVEGQTYYLRRSLSCELGMSQCSAHLTHIALKAFLNVLLS